MQELGIVTALHGSQAEVRITRLTACATCGKCGHGLDAPREMIVNARNGAGAAIGDAVRLHVEDVSFIKASAIVYGVPLVAVLLGFLIGGAIKTPSGANLAGPVGGLTFLASLVLVWLYDRRLRAAGKGQAVIVQVYGPGQEGDACEQADHPDDAQS